MAQSLADRTNTVADAVDRAVDDTGVHYPPERVGEIAQRFHDRVCRTARPTAICRAGNDRRRSAHFRSGGDRADEVSGVRETDTRHRHDGGNDAEGNDRLLREPMLAAQPGSSFSPAVPASALARGRAMPPDSLRRCSTGSWKTGSRKVWICRLLVAGRSRKPMTAEGIASSTSGIVIDGGDSCG